MNKEEIIKRLWEELGIEKWLINGKLENNTLTVEIPKGYKTLDIREKSEGDRHWIEIDLQEESKMCKIRQPHDGIDCPCKLITKEK